MTVTLDELTSRLDRIAGIYHKLDELIDQVPIELPDAVRRQIKESLLGNQDMAELAIGIKERRPPRFVLVGRTGVGKSSLINALAGRYLTEVSDVTVGTRVARPFLYKAGGRVLFEVIDTRGFAESLEEDDQAEAALQAAIRDFEPDALLFLTRAKERAHVDKDVAFVRSISSGGKGELPVVVVLAQADEMEPSRIKDPAEYSSRKLENIDEAVRQMRRIVDAEGLHPLDIVPVSAYIEWSPDPSELAPDERSEVSIAFDGRYNVDRLLDLLENNIDVRAGIFLMLATRLDQAARKVARKLSTIFATAAGAIGANPIPMSDLYILLALQSLLIMLIAYLAGEDISFATARRLILSLGGAGAIGLSFRALSQQLAKGLNLVLPGAGSVASGGVAAAATYGMGLAAIHLYIDGLSDDEVKATFDEARDEYAAGP